MKQLPYIASMLYGQPWAILPSVHAEFGSLYRQYLTGNLTGLAALAGPAALDRQGKVGSGLTYEANHQAGIAIISLSGAITKRTPETDCGPAIVDLCKLDALLDEVAADPLIETLVLDFNSPGGQMIGLVETSERLRELAGQGVRTIAYTDVLMCSAAYWLACACDEIYAAPSAVIGSIGVYCAGLDDSRAWEMEGVELVLAQSGAMKTMGHPGKAWTPEERQHLQAMVDTSGAEFRAVVTAARGAVPAEAMQGQWFFASKADASLLDGHYRDLPALLAELIPTSF